MTGRKVKSTIAVLLIAGILCGCAVQKKTQEILSDVSGEETAETAEEQRDDQTTENSDNEDQNAEQSAGPAQISERPCLLEAEEEEEISVVPSVKAYKVEQDLSNIDNLWQFYCNEEMTEKLVRNGFLVDEGAGSEFFEIYEMNRYMQKANFVTVDSLMHTYHLYFSYLLRNTERNYLVETISQLSDRMLKNSMDQYDRLKDSEWSDAAKRNVAFFTVGSMLLNKDAKAGDEVRSVVEEELARINGAEGVLISPITSKEEDYTQYKPRGYYENDEQLEKYFRVMMWYGRVHFRQEDEDLNRSALLISKALWDDDEAYRLWESVYAVTSFFAGASDDLGVCEYVPAIRGAYGEKMSLEDLIGNRAAFEKFCTEITALPMPQINSVPIWEGEDNVIPGFRFLGQRFTIDAAVMQKLIYSSVRSNSKGEKRMIPDVLDVPAALGSDTALEILQTQGDTDYEGYSENMERLRDSLSAENSALWSASLYAGWLNTLRPLLVPKGEGYPMFMQSQEWSKKDLECFAGSFAELKHDTILYSKQVIAEMGGGWEEEPDDRGYVEPEPAVYARFIRLADATAKGLKGYGMLGVQEEENLERLSKMASQLLTISQKELQEEDVTEEEYEFIRSYGGNIEHFWYEAVKEDSDQEYISSQECPAAVIADIATDLNGGRVLEVATGNPSCLLVVVKVDGKVKLASGSVYTFYQFDWPMDDRLTDTKWRQMMGIQSDENGEYCLDRPVRQPEWTESYRYEWKWE